MSGRKVFDGEYVKIQSYDEHGITHADVVVCNPGFSNPKGQNVITTPMLTEYSRALDELRKANVEYAIVEWAGPTTGFGASIKEFAEMLQDPNFATRWRDFLGLGTEIVLKISELPCYTISLMHGDVYGGSVELPLAYKRVIVNYDATFTFPEPGFGIEPGYGGVALVYERSGRHNTEQLVSTAGTITAQTAFQIGMVDRMSSETWTNAHTLIRFNEKPETEERNYQLTEQDIDISKRRVEPAPLVLERIPSIMNEIESAYKSGGIEAALRVNLDTCVELGSTNDFREGVAAFLEKRQPQYRGN